MNVILIKALIAFIPAGMLLAGSLMLYLRGKNPYCLLQVIGTACLVLVILAHIFEALQLFPWMRWGFQHSVGHYVDLWSAVLGLTLFPIGYLSYALSRRPV